MQITKLPARLRNHYKWDGRKITRITQKCWMTTIDSIFRTWWDSYIHELRVVVILCVRCVQSQAKLKIPAWRWQKNLKSDLPLVGELWTNYNLSILEEWGLVVLKGVTPEKLTTLQGCVPHPGVFKQHKLYLIVLKWRTEVGWVAK